MSAIVWNIAATLLWAAGAYLVSRSVFGLIESVSWRVRELTIGLTALFVAVMLALGVPC